MSAVYSGSTGALPASSFQKECIAIWYFHSDTEDIGDAADLVGDHVAKKFHCAALKNVDLTGDADERISRYMPNLFFTCLARNIVPDAPRADQDVIVPIEKALYREGHLAILKGNLAEDGAMAKITGLKSPMITGPAGRSRAWGKCGAYH